MPLSGEAIRTMNYVDDISVTLRRILAVLPSLTDDERQRVADHIKKLLRDGAERTVDKLWKLCGSILDQFTESECRNYFRHCGYRHT